SGSASTSAASRRSDFDPSCATTCSRVMMSATLLMGSSKRETAILVEKMYVFALRSYRHLFTGRKMQALAKHSPYGLSRYPAIDMRFRTRRLDDFHRKCQPRATRRDCKIFRANASFGLPVFGRS